MVLSKQEKDEVLYVYLVVADRVVSSVLLREDENKAQCSIYNVRRALNGLNSYT